MDVIVSNAVLQWVPEHRELLPRWVDALVPGGWLAFQVPGTFDAPSHVLTRELCRTTWRDRLGDLVREDPVDGPAGYLDLLAGLGCRVDAWETTYLHVLPGEDAVLRWITGTALRPMLDRLAPDEADAFLADLAAPLREAYPRQAVRHDLPLPPDLRGRPEVTAGPAGEGVIRRRTVPCYIDDLEGNWVGFLDG